MAEYVFDIRMGEVVTQVTIPDSVVQNIRKDAVNESRQEIREQAQNDLFSEIVTTIIEDIAAKEFKHEPDLTADEVEQIRDNYFTEEHPCNTASQNIDDLASGTMRLNILNDMVEFYDSRAKFFKFTVDYAGSFSVWVKARNEDEAYDYIEDHTRDLYDCLDPADAEYEVSRYSDDDQSEEPRNYYGHADYINAVE